MNENDKKIKNLVNRKFIVYDKNRYQKIEIIPQFYYQDRTNRNLIISQEDEDGSLDFKSIEPKEWLRLWT